jgi:hypothetical protein
MVMTLRINSSSTKGWSITDAVVINDEGAMVVDRGIGNGIGRM